MYPEHFIIHKPELQVKKLRWRKLHYLAQGHRFVNDGAWILTQVLWLQMILFFEVWCWDRHQHNQNLCNGAKNLQVYQLPQVDFRPQIMALCWPAIYMGKSLYYFSRDG